MNENKKKMEWHHWMILYTIAVFFDAVGFLMEITTLDAWTFGFAGLILSLITSLTVISVVLIWGDKGLMDKKFLLSLGITSVGVFGIEFFPIVGGLLPGWTFLVYRAKNIYEKGLSIPLEGIKSVEALKKVPGLSKIQDTERLQKISDRIPTQINSKFGQVNNN